MRWLVNAVIVVASVIFTVLFLNMLFNMAMPGIVNQAHFPRALIRELGPHYQTFYPSVNDGTFTNWTAVLGDSYGAGFGDAYRQNQTDYSIFHLIHNVNSENFYIFARGGYGSINSVREYFLTNREIDMALFYPPRTPPKKILFLFYEGNDLNNNIDHYLSNEGHAYTDIKDFVTQEIEKPHRSSRWSEYYLPVPDLLDLNTLKTIFGLTNRDGNDLKGKGKAKNVILLENGTSIPYQRFANGASPELKDQELDISLEIFFASMQYLKEKSGSTPISIVYIPSVVTTYRWKNPVQVRTYDTEQELFIDFEDNLKRSQIIRQRMAEFSAQNDVDFIDSTKYISDAAMTTYLHGTEDPGHFNLAGYQIISKLLLNSDSTCDTTSSGPDCQNIHN